MSSETLSTEPVLLARTALLAEIIARPQVRRGTPPRLGFLASHGGSNVQAILDAVTAGNLRAEPKVLICNNAAAPVLEKAKRAGLPWAHLNERTHPNATTSDEAIRRALEEHDVELVILAGYMKRLGAAVLERYPRQVLNIHPALLPRHGGQGMYGKHVHRAVLASGDLISGATVHLVDSEYDHGERIAQMQVPVVAQDTPETLAARVLRAEHHLYPWTLARLLAHTP